MVKVAKEKSALHQKYHYDKARVHVEFEVGQHVLVREHRKLAKHHFKWSGPYEVVQKFNPVAYLVRDLKYPNKTPRRVIIRDLYAIRHPSPELEKEIARTPLINPPTEFKPGRFIIYRIRQSGHKWRKRIYVAEIYGPLDPVTNILPLHYFTHLEPDGSVDLEKPLEERKLLPEWSDARGNFTESLRRKTESTEPNVTEVYPQEIDILAVNFPLLGLRLPKEAVLEAKNTMLKRDAPAARRHAKIICMR
mmetsp:Transcript_22612/g.70766  ORF Transcript_22612/g.70766 Transcript_22612/m.70766 type:complete len:249 (-) Transcript_22612:1876-2622(-)